MIRSTTDPAFLRWGTPLSAPSEEVKTEETEEVADTETETEEETETPDAGDSADEREESDEEQAREDATFEALAARIAKLEEKLAKAEEDKDKSFGTCAGFGVEGKDIKDMSYEELKRKMFDSGDIVSR